MRLQDRTLLVDDVCDATRVFVFRGIRRAVVQSDRPLDIAEQREREVELLGELAVVRGRIEADAEDEGVLCFVFRLEVPEPGTLTRSTRGVSLRIEPEHDFLAAQLREPHTIAEMIVDFEIRSRTAGRQHLCLPSQERLDDSTDGHVGSVAGCFAWLPVVGCRRV
jgi:hypothetical protein